jgi:anti-sigma B factor antagonist
MSLPETGLPPASREGRGELQITAERDGGTVVLTLHGELDLQSVGRLRTCLAETLERDSGAVLVDLTDVAFIDSTGLAALLNALRRLTRAGRPLLLVAGEGPVRRVLRLTRLDSTFALHDTRESALATA